MTQCRTASIKPTGEVIHTMNKNWLFIFTEYKKNLQIKNPFSTLRPLNGGCSSVG